MTKPFSAFIIACCVLFFSSQLKAETHFYGLLDFRIANTDNYGSWLEGNISPFRIDETDNALNIGQAILFSRIELGNTTELVSQFSAYNDQGDALGVGEFYLKFDSDPHEKLNFNIKAGAFFPEISLENIGPGWTTRNPLSTSTINTWIGEEIRIVGIQPTLEFQKRFFEREWTIGASAAATTNNDPAGAMLAWRGWALHDRQTRIEEQLPITQLTFVGGDTGFVDQTAWYQPVYEVDGRVGFSNSIYLKRSDGINLRWYHYDNRANSKALKQGQYGWHTRFDHLGLALPISTSTRLNTQWIRGTSMMGDPDLLFVDIQFSAWHIGITQKYRKFYFDLRFESFDVIDRDGNILDDSTQEGNAWVAAVRYDINSSLALLAEHVEWKDEKIARQTLNLPLDLNTKLTQLALQWRF